MASKASVSGFRGFSTVLSSAVLEWILMFLLFFDALFSYLVTKFSRLCKLQTPCMCCSRLDHIFGNERPGFYVDLICENHRAEISPLSFYSDHGGLADIHTLCQDCLLKRATERKPNLESYKSLNDKFDGHFNHGDPRDIQDIDDDILLKSHEDDLTRTSLLEKDVEPNAIRSLEDKSIKAGITEIDIPLSSSAGPSHLQVEDGVRKTRESTSVSPNDDHLSDQGFHHFSHVGESEDKSAFVSETKDSLKDDDKRKSLNEDGRILDDLSSAAEHNSLQAEDRSCKTDDNTMVSPRNHSLHKFHGDDLTNTLFLKKDVELNASRLLEGKSIRAAISEVDIPSSSLAGPSHLQVEVGVRKTRESTPLSPKDDHLNNQGFDHFSHVGYSEVTWTSDSESKVPLQDDDERKPLINEDGHVVDDLVSHIEESESTFVAKNIFSVSSFDDRTPEELIYFDPISTTNDNDLEKLNSSNSAIDEPSEPTPEKQINIDEFYNTSTSSTSKTTAEHCLDDSKCNQIEEAVCGQFESGPQDHQEVPMGDLDVRDNLESSDPACVHTTDDASEPDQSTSIHMDLNDAYKLAIGTDGSLSSPSFNEVIKENNPSSVQEDLKMEPGPCTSNHMDLNDVYKLAVGTKERLPSHEEVTMRKNSSSIQEDIKSESGQSVGNHMDLNDAYKFAIGTKGSLTSPRLAEVLMGKDSSRVQEDLKLLISQISAARGLDSPWIEMSPSPRSYGQGAEPVLQHITKTLSLERNESGVESLDGSIVSELEGESAVERLKRQIDLDRKSISLLYKELEEERNASAIAANQAMAMITRLQEEKAAMQMEALQYQRMMEDQAEYDQEALQKCNELIVQREKELQDLEAELESYRKRFADEFFIDKTEQNGNFHDKEIAFCDKSRETKKLRWRELENSNDPLSRFEDEATYISNCLKKLEEKLHLFSNNGIYDDVSSFNLNDDDDDDDKLPEQICADVHEEYFIDRNVESVGELGTNGQFSDGVAGSGIEQCHLKSGPLEIAHIGENNMLEKKIPRKNSSSVEGNRSVRSDTEKQYLSKFGKKNELVSLENEVSRLTQRLEVLEADRNFLEHAINSLRNGNDGVRFIQEIACDLRELRRIGTRDHLAA